MLRGWHRAWRAVVLRSAACGAPSMATGGFRIYRELYERGKRAANSTASCIFRDTDAEVAAIRAASSRNDAGATSSSAIRRASL